MDKNNILIVKSNNLVESRYKLKLEEQRLLIYLISRIKKTDTDFKEYKINIKDFCELTGADPKNAYRNFMEISDSLISKTIRIKENNNTITLAWLAQTIYHDGEGAISVSFAPRLKPYLLDLKKNFTAYPIENILNLKSVFSIRIFELLKQYQKLKYRIFNIQELKEILGVEKNYSRYNDFKRFVILSAEKELKEKCDIWFSFEEIKESRRVSKIKFLIHKNEIKLNVKQIADTEIDSSETSPSEETAELIKELKTIIKEALPDKDLLAIWKAADGNVDLIKNRYDVMKAKREVNNITGFMIWALGQSDEQFKAIISKKKNAFQNFEAQEWDFDKIKKLEEEYIERKLKEE